MRKHGLKETKAYGSWRAMRKRCLTKTNKDYKNYGGRGITICSEWGGIDGFVTFYADMGERPEGKTLDRIDNDGPYTKENCRWATIREQRLNQNPKGMIESRAKKIEPGTKFGRLTCVRFIGLKPKMIDGMFCNHEGYHIFDCDCGRTVELRTRVVLHGSNKSCGFCPRTRI